MSYKKLDTKYYNILAGFSELGIKYLLFKCEHMFDGIDGNLDILFETVKDYQMAAKHLESLGFKLYMGEGIEKFKLMYVKVVSGKLYSFHLHREVAWHNLRIMKKADLFLRSVKVSPNIIVPSAEDSLVIHACHTIFENHSISPYTRKLTKSLLARELDWEYVKLKTKSFSYEFDAFVNGKTLSTTRYNLSFMRQLMLTPGCYVSFTLKLFRAVLRKLSVRRKGCLISLIGVQGAGKTTLARELLTAYKPVTIFFFGQKGYYFGWDPFFPLTKLLSRLLRKKKIYNSMNQKSQKFSLYKELVILYNFLEYLLRYVFTIYPWLRRGRLVVTDRYFYDVYAQYSYSTQSVLIKSLLYLYPRPNFLFVLEADPQIVSKRGKDARVYSNLKKGNVRKNVNLDTIRREAKKYSYLCQKFSGSVVNTQNNVNDNVDYIISKTWHQLL